MKRSYFQLINMTWVDIKWFLTMLDTWVNFKVCLLDKHLSGDVNFVYWIWLKSFSARKLTTFSWSRQWCYQLPWFCGKSWLVSLARISTSCYLCLKTLGKLTHTLYTYYVLTVNKKTIDLGKKSYTHYCLISIIIEILSNRFKRSSHSFTFKFEVN